MAARQWCAGPAWPPRSWSLDEQQPDSYIYRTCNLIASSVYWRIEFFFLVFRETAHVRTILRYRAIRRIHAG